MRIEKLTANIGAEVIGIDLAEAARNDDLFGAIRGALLEHKVLFLRGQDIARADHVAFATRFGSLEDHPVAGSDPENPGLVRIYKDENSPPDYYENAWHCDATWREAPPMGCVLRCVACPPVGGDTMWANMARAYEDLPDHVKQTIAPLKARHSIEASFGARMPEERRHALKAQYPDAEHPVVRTHPETGEKVLFVNGFTTHFTNFHTAENVRYGQDHAPGGANLLQYLIGRAAIPEYQVRWRWQPNSVAIWDNRATQHYAVMDYAPTVRRMERGDHRRQTPLRRPDMQFFDDSLLPENQEPLVIQVAPYAPSFFPRDSDDIPVTFAEQVQKAVDCYNAGATVLHVHVREPDGNGSKDLDRFNEMLDRLRTAVPGMILQVGGSISFAPKDEGQAALWLADDTRHKLAELTPAPDQVTLAVNTNQMNVMELITEDDAGETSMYEPAYREAYTEMYYEAGPRFMKEHMKRLSAAGIQTHFMVGCVRDLETVERLVRNGHYMGPLVLNWVAIGGGHDGPNPRNLMEFINRCPQNAVLTVEGLMRSVYPLCTMGIAMGLHARVGQEDNLWGRKGERATSVQQIEKIAKISQELWRPIASAADARRIYRIGEFYSSIDETLEKNGWLPNRKPVPAEPLRAIA